ncbi:6608_t:CDS:2, partial [Gigaspora margarita]
NKQENENTIPQQAEQSKKHKCQETKMEQDGRQYTKKLKDITNITSPSVNLNMIITHTESSDKKESALSCNKENVQTGLGGLTDNNFLRT